MKDRRPALCKVMFLFKNGTSITLDTPLSFDQVGRELTVPVDGWIQLDIYEKEPKIAQGKTRITADEILTVTIFEIEQNPIVAVK